MRVEAVTVNTGKLKKLRPKKDSGVDQTELVVMDMGNVEQQKVYKYNHCHLKENVYFKYIFQCDVLICSGLLFFYEIF